jgi:predicted MFS family arabinose efflux permease
VTKQSSNAALVLAAGFLVLFVGGGTRFAIGLTLKPMVDEFGWGRSELGLAVGVYMAVSAATMFVAGRFADRTGPRLVLGGGLLISGISIGLMSYVSAPWHAVLLYGVVFGIGNGAASLIPIGVMVTRAFPHRAGTANAAVMSGMSVGQLMMIAGLAAVLLAVNWHAVYLWLGAANLLLLPLVLLAIPKGSPAQAKAAQPEFGVGVLSAAKTRQLWLLLGVYAICGFDDFFVTTHIVAFAQDRGVDAFLAGNLLALMGLTGLIGVVAGGALSDRAGPVWPTALAFAGRNLRACVRRNVPGDRAAHRRVRVGKLRQAPSRRAHGADHDGAPDLRRDGRLPRRRGIRRDRRLHDRVLDHVRSLAHRAHPDADAAPPLEAAV